jgi:hypothetical protein
MLVQILALIVVVAGIIILFIKKDKVNSPNPKSNKPNGGGTSISPGVEPREDYEHKK